MPSKDEYYDLGSYSRTISTTSTEAQIWFNRGLIWCYGFNHEESVVCFQRAIDADHTCALAYWGLAYALGPNYNKPWEFFADSELPSVVERTHQAVSKAKEHAAGATPVEQKLINALQFRYPESVPAKDFSIWNAQYAAAMEDVYQQFPDDLEVTTLCADALMNLTPWQLWDLATGEPSPDARTLDIKRILDRAFEKPHALEHPGLLHLYIHLMEMSGHPEEAMPIADRLRGLVPDAGHLNHMPSHLDILCGDYRRAISANTDAMLADEKYLDNVGPQNFYTLYRAHDYHFRVYAAMFCGQLEVALDTVDRIEASIPPESLKSDTSPMADWLEAFLAMRAHVYVRFGKWQEIIDLVIPEDPELFCVSTAMLHYAKAIAYAAIGQIPEALSQRGLFLAAYKRVPESRTLFNNKCVDILAVAEAMLEGEIEYRQRNFDAAFEHLRKSIQLYDNMPYDEPWGWMQPTRHAYGALLLEQGHAEEAAAVYSADLGMDNTLPRALWHPNNVWSLHGYHESLVKLGRTEEARIIKPQLDLAVAIADVPIKSSCYCRLEKKSS